MSKFHLYRLTSGWLLAAMAAGAQAADLFSTTSTTRGREPIAALTFFTPVSPMPEDTVTLSFFSNADGNAESESIIQWFRNGPIMLEAANANLLLDQNGIGGSFQSAIVTPKTDPTITEPSIGNELASAPMRAESRLISNFFTPDTTLRNWSEANSHCQGWARLPTIDEPQQLFVDSTISPTLYPNPGYIGNHDLCDLHGWPQSGYCRGSIYARYYWSSTPIGGHYHLAIMTTGHAAYSLGIYERQAACARALRI